jgi:monothiol glutaredoxin
VLENDEIRESIKKFSDWSTIPQLYIKEEFIVGCDITREMYEKGELQSLLKEKNYCGISTKKPVPRRWVT